MDSAAGGVAAGAATGNWSTFFQGLFGQAVQSAMGGQSQGGAQAPVVNQGGANQSSPFGADSSGWVVSTGSGKTTSAGAGATWTGTDYMIAGAGALIAWAIWTRKIKV